MINKYVLPYLSKQEDIGNTLQTLNKCFSDLNLFFDLERELDEDISNFAQNIDVIYDQLFNACSFLEQNKNNLSQKYLDVNTNKIKWLKPIILFYIEKVYDKSSIFSVEYIEDMLCKWMQTNYPVKTDNISKPNYIDGQIAFIYYLKSLDQKENYYYSNEKIVNCQTQNINITVNCSTTTSGRACAGSCGCIDCAGTSYCKQTKPITCVFTDRGLSLKQINRYLKLNAIYINDDSAETSVQSVKLIVKNCEWNINKA
jgi:hypothetical protein